MGSQKPYVRFSEVLKGYKIGILAQDGNHKLRKGGGGEGGVINRNGWEILTKWEFTPLPSIRNLRVMTISALKNVSIVGVLFPFHLRRT